MTDKRQKVVDKKLFSVWNFDKTAIRDMQDLTIDTRFTKIEHGGLLCTTNNHKNRNKIKIENKCVGDSCSIMVHNENCSYKKVGTFHTHPNDKISQLSLNDMKNSFVNADHISCIGTPNSKKDRITCFAYKNLNKQWNDLSDEQLSLDKMIKVENTTEHIDNEEHSKYLKYKKQYQDKFFTQFNPEDYVAKE